MSFDWLLDIVFPQFCLGCGTLGNYLCPKCVAKINFYVPQTCPYCETPSPHGLTHPRCHKPWGLDGMFVLAHYDGLIPEIIHRVKYAGEHAVLADVADVVSERYERIYQFDYFVPVPLSKKRERERGFNQARKLARQLSVMLASPASLSVRDSGVANAPQNDGIKVVDLLIRTRETRPQFELKYDDRKQNMKDAFALTPNLLTPNLSQYSFCLVDDVATTGATILECAKVLKRAGADKVWAICIARGG